MEEDDSDKQLLPKKPLSLTQQCKFQLGLDDTESPTTKEASKSIGGSGLSSSTPVKILFLSHLHGALIVEALDVKQLLERFSLFPSINSIIFGLQAH